MLSARARHDDDAILGIVLDLLHRVDHIDHQLKTDGVGALGAIESEVTDTVLTLENYGFVLHALSLYIENE